MKNIELPQIEVGTPSIECRPSDEVACDKHSCCGGGSLLEEEASSISL